MSELWTHTDDGTFTVNGDPRNPRKYSLRTPTLLANYPALLINLAGRRQDNFDVKGHYGIVPAIFTAAGHHVAAFDLPFHGERKNSHGEGLAGMVAAMKAGEDVFADIAATGKALIDALIAQGIGAPGRIVVNGISRGGLAGLHVMAADKRVLAGAVHAPMTRPEFLREWEGMGEHPLVQKAHPETLIPRLANRGVFMAMGYADPRVSAEHGFTFMARLAAAARVNRPELFTASGESHGKGTFPSELGYHAAAAYLLKALVEQAKPELVA